MLAFVGFAFLVAGSVKGLVGIGLPTTAIGIMTLSIDPRAAIAIILFPMVISNAWQVYRQGEILRTARRYGVFAIILFVGVWLTSMLTHDVPDRVLLGVLGSIILLFVAVNLVITVPALSDRFDMPAQATLGLVAGVMGGLTAVWAPPMVIYLTARQVPKEEFVRASGFLIVIGSLPLTASYIQLGHMTGPLAWVSLIMLVPTLLGFSLGERLRSRISAERFRVLLLYIFLLLGLNLIRRAIWG